MKLLCSFRILRTIAIALALGFTLCWAAPAASPKGASRDRTVTTRSLPGMDGTHLKATIVEVTYAPGEFSPPHSHPCPVIGYVLEGAVRMKTKGQSEAIYKAGESFYEAPNGTHEISANASSTKPAKFLAYFICDQDTPLSVAPPKN